MAFLALTPRGHLRLIIAGDLLELPPALVRRLENAFARGSGHGLLELGVEPAVGQVPPIQALADQSKEAAAGREPFPRHI
jgi:hypothetical protein